MCGEITIAADVIVSCLLAVGNQIWKPKIHTTVATIKGAERAKQIDVLLNCDDLTTTSVPVYVVALRWSFVKLLHNSCVGSA